MSFNGLILFGFYESLLAFGLAFNRGDGHYYKDALFYLFLPQ